MNKEEIEKQDRKIKISMPLLTQKEMLEIDNNFDEIVKEFIKQYIREKDLAIAKYIIDKQQKELEQKSNVLDKIKDFVTKISTENAEKYNSIKQKEVDFSEWNLADGILNIIEGEREYCCTCGVELNSENKALNNMCNECKYGLDYQKEREEK